MSYSFADIWSAITNVDWLVRKVKMSGDHRSGFIICGTQISVQNWMAINAIAVEIFKTKVGEQLNDGTFPSPESQHPQEPRIQSVLRPRLIWSNTVKSCCWACLTCIISFLPLWYRISNIVSPHIHTKDITYPIFRDCPLKKTLLSWQLLVITWHVCRCAQIHYSCHSTVVNVQCNGWVTSLWWGCMLILCFACLVVNRHLVL